MITVPTADLPGLLSDAAHFIPTDKDDDEGRSIHLQWDGSMLHASATDTIRSAISSWHPADDPDTDVQDALGVELGGADDPWHVVLGIDDVAHLLTTAKPIKNLEYVPLILDYAGGVLSVKRAKQARVPGFSIAYDGRPYPFADLRLTMVDALGRVEAVKEIWFNGPLMASFAKARQRGHAAKWTFAGPDRPAVVEIGERFVGAILPVRNGSGE